MWARKLTAFISLATCMLVRDTWGSGGKVGVKGLRASRFWGKTVIPENRVRDLSYIYSTAGREFALHAIRFNPWHPLWPPESASGNF